MRLHACMQQSTIDEMNPAVPVIRKIPQFPSFKIRKAMLRIYIINRNADLQRAESFNP